jgi:hypothetical protein
MSDTLPSEARPATPVRVCHLSRRRGWIDPFRPRRAASEVNLLAIYLDAPVWTLGTAWESIFRRRIPASVENAYRKATARIPLTEGEVAVLQTVAERLGVRLEVQD